MKKTQEMTRQALLSQGYTEDTKAAAQWSRIIRYPALLLMIGCVGGVACMFVGKMNDAHGVAWALGFGLSAVLWHMLHIATFTPHSRHTGKQIKRYRCKDAAGNTTVVYVCEDSRTFFQFTWSPAD
jgi:hypothetical protein